MPAPASACSSCGTWSARACCCTRWTPRASAGAILWPTCLRAAEGVREALERAQVLFVPSAVPPHRAQPSAGALERYAMVALGTAGHAPFLPSDLELRREGPSYTVDTVAALREAHAGAEIV